MNRRKLQRRNYTNEYEIRREVEGVYWKQEDTFSSSREFNNYLEDIENAIEELMEGGETLRKERLLKMEYYKEDNPSESASFIKFGRRGVNILRSGASHGASFTPISPLNPITNQEWVAKCDATQASRMEFNIVTPQEAAAAGYQSHRPWTYSRALAYA